MPLSNNRQFESDDHEWPRSRWVRHGFFVALGCLLLSFFLSGCAGTGKTSRLELVPVAEPATGVYFEGKFVWNDLLTDNVAEARDFYGPLFNWTFEQRGRYTVIKNDNRNIGGMVQIGADSGTPAAARWLCAISVADVDQAAALAVAEGGKLLKGPLEMVNRGRGALISDPQQAQLLLMHAAGGDPEDREPPLGGWLWHELWSNAPDASLAFYRKLVGYDSSSDPTDYLILLKGDQWRAGIRVLSNPDLEMRWIPVVRVADTTATAALVEKLGGKILVEPRATPSGGSVALLSDPSGALLIFQQWDATNSGREE